MKPHVAKAVDELDRAFPSSPILSREDGEGGAYVIVEHVTIGPKYKPCSTWFGGHITALYPYADIYPLFIGADVRRVNGVAFDAPVTPGAQFEQRPALQVSRRNNHTQNYPQTAVAKFLKVQQFLAELP
ncbi:MAG: hypothetical protein OXQ29_27450 [Rhodospirillaceae bacterium]|nr:hypothetical protein [Rhodospirillaceae bacterium]